MVDFPFFADRLLPTYDRTPLEFQENARRLRPRLIFSELRAGFCTDIPGRNGEDIGFNLTFTAFSANLRRPVAIRKTGGFFPERGQTLFYSTRKGSEKHVAFREKSGPFKTAA